MSIIIAGERSGVGKTTITLAILAFLAQKGNTIQSFKVGPDYIDPMFHSAITGRSCRNLDPILTSENYVKSCFRQHSQNVDYSLIEGVMGLFDGVQYEQIKDYASTAHIARLLNIPVILVIDCRRLSGSVAAIAQGFRTFDPQVTLAGVILNQVGSDRHLELLQDSLKEIQIPILGVIRRQDWLILQERHLGLVPTQELTDLKPFFQKLASLAQRSLNWDKLFPLLRIHHHLEGETLSVTPIAKPVRLAIAFDQAFSFYYQDNLDLLEKLGAKLIYWSPLAETSLPNEIHGLYFGGGFPEIFAQTLAENQIIRDQIRNAIAEGLPTYAECGGLMYLCEQLIDLNGNSWPMVGSLHAVTRMEKKLTLGYRLATALKDSSILRKGEQVRGHEFHHSTLSAILDPLYELQAVSKQAPKTIEGWATKNLHASYLHLHFGEYPALAQRFLNDCLAISEIVH